MNIEMKDKDYKYSLEKNKEHPILGKYNAVILDDTTSICFLQEKKSVYIEIPENRYHHTFKDDAIGILFDQDELLAIAEGFKELYMKEK